MAELKTLQDLLNLEVQMLYSAEKLILANLPRLAEKASSRELSLALSRHQTETRQQRERLKQVGELLGFDPDGEPNPAMKGLFAEADKVFENDPESVLLDAALIAWAQKIEHYEISSYATAAYLAAELGHTEVAELLRTNLEEEQKVSALFEELVPVYLGLKTD